MDALIAGSVADPTELVLIDPSETVFPPITIVAFMVTLFGRDFTTGATAWPVLAVTVGALAEVVDGLAGTVLIADAALCPDN